MIRKEEIELTRTNVTPAQFAAYVRQQIKKHNFEVLTTDYIDYDYWKRGGDLEFNVKGTDPEKDPCKAEKSVSKPYEMQTYIRNWDGTVYNMIMEFEFWDEKTGNGYFYFINTWNEEEEETTEERGAQPEQKGERTMKKYRNTESGEIWTLDEVKEAFEQFRYEIDNAPEDVEDYINNLVKAGSLEEMEYPPYIVIDERRGDIFTEYFKTAEEAVKYAKDEWDRLTKYEKEKCIAFYVLKSIDPDPESERHFDGEPIWNAREQYFVRYHTGAGDVPAETLEEAKEKAERGACYTGQDISIEDYEGAEITRRVWYGYEPDEEEKERDIIEFGKFGFYDEWTE